jgi:hypothetical protein
MVAEVQQLIRAAREVQSLTEIEAIRRRVDAVVEGLTGQAARGDLDAERTAVVAVAVGHVDRILAERRDALLCAEATRPAQVTPLRQPAE